MRKRILLIHHYGGIGGAGLSLLHIVKSIDAEKYDLTIACPTYPDNMYVELEKLGFKVIKLDSGPIIFNHYNGGIPYIFSFRGIKNLLKIQLSKKEISSLLKEEQPDIVIVNSMTLGWIGKIAKQLRMTTICFHRETYKSGKLNISNSIIKRQLSRYFDKVVFISQYDCKETLPITGIPFVVYDRVDVEEYNKYSKKSSRKYLGLDLSTKYILYVGGYSKLKGYQVLLNSIKKMKDEPNVKFVFLGWTAENEKELKKKVIDKNIESKIIMYEPTVNPQLFFKACDIVVFPSIKAHQARPIYEAGISKIPIILSDFENTNEFAENNVSAFTFERNNSESLSNTIKKVLKMDDETLEKIVLNNYFMSLERHDLSTLPIDIENVLRNEGVTDRKV